MNHELTKSGLLKILMCDYKENEKYQKLHAKAIAIEKNNNYRFMFGSANFTIPGMMASITKGNLELNMIFNNMPKTFYPNLLFDPENTAWLLKDLSDLKTEVTEKIEKKPKNEVSILEAEVAELRNTIKINTQFPQSLSLDNVRVKLTFHDGDYKKYSANYIGNNIFEMSLNDETIHLINKGSTLLQLIVLVKDTEIKSNIVFLINIKDIKTGSSVKRERYIKQAQENATLFIKILDEIEGNEEQIRLLLMYCDIPTDIKKPLIRSNVRLMWEGKDGMRTLGEKNFVNFNNLHDVSISFYDKHFRKLHNINDYGGIKSISKFIQISISMLVVILSQLERAYYGLDSRNEPLSTDEWFECRSRFDIYMYKFKLLMGFMEKDYLPRILSNYSIKELNNVLDNDTEELCTLPLKILEFHDVFEEMRNKKLCIKKLHSRKIPARFLQNNIFYGESWKIFSNHIVSTLNNIEKITDYSFRFK